MRHEIDDECVCSDGYVINDDISSNGSMFSIFRLSATAARDAAANFLFLRNECDRSPAEDEIRMNLLKTSIKSSYDV